MSKQVHEGILFQDQNQRYYIYERARPVSQMVTLTSGCALEIFLDGAWVSGHVEGDGQDYWFFTETGSKFKLVEGMAVRYTEPCWLTAYDQPPIALLEQ